jgi:putative ABC transport system permease protein
MKWRDAMLKNYLKIAFRKMSRQKIYTLINVLGLAFGMASVIFILIWVRDEQSYDRFHDDADRIYRVSQIHCVEGKVFSYTNTPAILAKTVILECPEVELATSVRGDSQGTLVFIEDRQYHESKIGMTDDMFFQVFSFPFSEGNPATALDSPQTVVLSEQAAHRYFGTTNPIGKTLTFYDDDFLVTGVFENMPSNSHFHFDVLCSITSFEQWRQPDWSWNPVKTYVRVRSGADIPALQSKLNDIAGTRMFGEGYAEWAARGNSKTLPLQALTDIHLNSHLHGEFEANGNGMYVRFFTIIAGFILLIAAVNYMNLSTARSAGRALEVGIRKTVGSTRTSLIRQFLSESILTSLLALILALLVIQALMPAYRQLVGKPWLDIPYIQSPMLVFPLVLLTILIGLFAGIYPSLFLSSLSPIAVLGGNFSSGLKRSRLRHGLVVFQFSLSILLFSGTLVVRKQMAFIQSQDLGFQREHVVVLQTLGQINQRLPVFKNALLSSPDIVAVSASSSVPGKGYNSVGFHVEGSHDSWPATICIAADVDFLEVMQLEMDEGRFFDKKIPSDRQAVVINACKARSIDSEDLFSERIRIGGMGEVPFHVIGVVGDIHYESFHEPVKALGIVLLSNTEGWTEDYISVRIRSDHIHGTMAFIQKAWEDFIPGSPFAYAFLDAIHDDMYRNEMRTGRLFSLFTLFALFVTCLGLLGLASYAAAQRKKEFGIRKVLGANAASIIILLSREYQKLIILANCIAWPLAYLLMKRWLQSFAYRTSIGIFIFLAAGFLVLAIACLAVIYHSLKAASADPVESLKYE